jgi:hypothetical protein
MHRLILVAVLTLGGALAAGAQDVPHDFKQDTPSVPGQVVETPRDKLRVAPNPLPDLRPVEPGLPTSGPKGVVRESSNDEKYASPIRR